MHIHEIDESFTKLSYLQRSTIVHSVDERTPAKIEICKTWVKIGDSPMSTGQVASTSQP